MNEVIASLPCTAGVYFFYGRKDELIYVGKSINIRKRVQQHFSGQDRKSLKIQFFTKRIAFEVMGSELISLLYESHLIKKHQPIYNRSQRRAIYQYGLYLRENEGYKRLIVDKIMIDEEEITSFSTLHEAKTALFYITESHRLCQKINKLYKSSYSCFQYQIKECNGACIGKESADDYNVRVNDFLKKASMQKFTRLFEVAGRTPDEVGLVYIQNGVYKGFGFCSKNTSTNEKLSFIEPYQDNKDVRRILARYLLTE